MRSETCFCGSCQETNKNYAGLDVQDGRWLEEMGDMIEVAVKGLKKDPAFSTGCYGKRFRG